MTMPARSVRSKTSADKGHPRIQEMPTRPELSLIKGTGKARRPERGPFAEGARRLIGWTRTRGNPLLRIMTSVIFLAACMFGSLMLRTQMVQDSFEATRVQHEISNLTQDVQDDQNKLDQLQASLPDKAQQLGMQPQQGLNSIDLQGYKPPQDAQSKAGHP
ncbi:hypothetical protein [Bifidobacterium sp. B4142]|uniref:hypothetical protein n=1 Tax=Bifidobacterium sp. B4142 TaxID=2817962 RepID=UPI00226B3C62|nr:hypothetical protein [Bifidobacterium sp. B4142]